MNIGIGIKLPSDSVSYNNIFDYDTTAVNGDGRGDVVKIGGGEITYTVTTTGGTHGVAMPSFLEIGNSYKLTFEAKSDLITGGAWNMGGSIGDITTIETHDLAPSYQRYEFDFTTDSTLMRMYFLGTNSAIGAVITYKDIIVYEL